MSGAVTAIALQVSGYIATAALEVGVPAVLVDAAGPLLFAGVSLGVTTGIAAGIGAAFAPKIPDAVSLQTPIKQAMPQRQSAFGRVRVGGAYALYTVGDGDGKNVSYDVLALLDGKSNAVVQFYLNDDLMAPYGSYYWAPGATGKYGGGGSNPPNLVQIDSRLGLDTETAYAISSNVALWDSAHRGDGVTSMLLECKQAKGEDQAGDFPNGLPQPSAVIDAQLVYDPRDGTQTQGTKSTYKFSDNAILCLLAYLTDANGGMGLDYARFILPAVSLWEAAADEADGLVGTSGMHATLLDAAAVGDHKIFVADQMGLTVGTVIHLPTETVTVSALATAGEVDFTTPSGLAYTHSVGELAYWDGFGQRLRYRCAGTYRHDTPPGDVVKSILAAFDGWLGQRGDGALIPRTSTVYDPTVVLTDDHIVGYQVQHFLPEEQATNQYIVSYTDPASAFNKAEAGYVEDDADIAARGTVRSNELYLQWCPSAPQALSVARTILARSTQALRGTITCSLAGLAVMGERYVRLQISELTELNDIIVEVTGKVSIDVASMTVSFPWVAASAAGSVTPPTPQARVQEQAQHASFSSTLPGAPTAGNVLLAMGTGQSFAVVNSADGWAEVDRHEGLVTPGGETIYAVVAWKRAGSGESSTQTPFTGTATDQDAVSIIEISNCGDLPGSLESLTWASPASPTSGTGSADATATAVTAADNDFAVGFVGWYYFYPYFDTVRLLGTGWTNIDGDVQLASAGVVGSQAVATAGTTLTATGDISHPWYHLITCLLVFSVTVRDSLSPLAPPSGSPLQPLTAPTITSVTPVYPNSGGGVAGATASIVVVDPGGNVTWKVQWKLTADTVWTDAGSSYTADGGTTIQTGLIPATGSVDFQVAYIAGSQVSPWSSTTTATIAAPVTGTSTLTASEALTAGQIVNIWASSGAEVRPADVSDDAHGADGFVLAGFASAATATVYLPGQVITGLTGLTPGATYFLAASGGVTVTAPSSGWRQVVGKALSATTLLFQPDQGTFLS